MSRCIESMFDVGFGHLILVRKSCFIARAKYIAPVFFQLLLDSYGMLGSGRPANFVHNMMG